jgi:hypothetical protein
MVIASFLNRSFQLWEYRVSHGMLLVRSPQSPVFNINIDIVFAGVEFLSIPRRLVGLQLDQGTDVAIDRIAANFRQVERRKIFAMVSGSHRYLIVAAGAQVTEHQGDIFDSPFRDDRQ